MNVLEVRPLLFQVRALMTQGVIVYGACIWDKTQDPSITPKLLEDNPDVDWLSWYPKSSSVESFLDKILFFRRAYDKYVIDVVQINGLRDLLAAFCGRIFSQKKPKIFVTSHNPEIWNNPRQVFRNVHFINLLSDGIITLSTKNMNLLLRQGISRRKLRFIPNAFLGKGVDLSGRNRNQNMIILFYPASVIPRKNQFLILKIISELKNKLNLFAYFAGEMDADREYVKSLLEYCQENGLQGRVHFMGKIPHAEVLSTFDQCDFVVFPTRAEMMPRAVIEAMWLGKPVIASRVDGIPDLIKDHETGILIDPDDVDGFVTAICELAENPELALRIARAGQKFVREFCSLESVGKSMVDFYLSIRRD